jgi:tetratricopeptide (TPR) repeat protein
MDVNRLIEEARQARLNGRPLEGLRLLEQAHTLVVEAKDEARQAVILKAIGQLRRDQGHPSALALHEEAAIVQRRLGDASALAHTLRHVGDLAREGGDLAKAEASISEALDIYAHHPPDALEMANTLRVYAILKEAQGADAEALQLWVRARDGYRDWNPAIDNPGVSEAEDHLRRLAP